MEIDKEQIKLKYDANISKYKRGGENISEAIGIFLTEKEIPYLTITHRVKEFESFYEKIHRKNYDDPFEKNEDFCGIRVILYHLNDIERIEKIFESEFKIITNESKSDELNVNEFGYRSNHYIIYLKDSWCETPNYRGLKGVKFEVQLRTILMHAWAEIEHKLGYKNRDQIPITLQRKLFLISAKLEDADTQFQEIKNSADEYKLHLVQKAASDGKFSTEEFNLDTLEALADFYFPKLSKHQMQMSDMYDTVVKLKIPVHVLVEYVEKVKPLSQLINDEIFGRNSKRKTSQANLISYAVEAFHDGITLEHCDKNRRKVIAKIKKMVGD